MAGSFALVDAVDACKARTKRSMAVLRDPGGWLRAETGGHGMVVDADLFLLRVADSPEEVCALIAAADRGLEPAAGHAARSATRRVLQRKPARQSDSDKT